MSAAVCAGLLASFGRVFEPPTLIGAPASSASQNPTFSGLDFGAAHPYRLIIAGVTNSSSPARSIDSCIFGAVTGTKIDEVSIDTFRRLAMFAAIVPTGTTGQSIQVNQSGATSGGMRIIVLRAAAMAVAASASGNASATATSVGKALTIPNGGFGVWFAAHRGPTGVDGETAWSGTGMSLIGDGTLSGQSHFSAGYSKAAESVTGTATWSSSDVAGIVGGTWG